MYSPRTTFSPELSTTRNLFSVHNSSVRRSIYYIEDVNASNILDPKTINKHKLLNSFDQSTQPSSVSQRVNLSVEAARKQISEQNVFLR